MFYYFTVLLYYMFITIYTNNIIVHLQKIYLILTLDSTNVICYMLYVIYFNSYIICHPIYASLSIILTYTKSKY